MPHLKEAKLVWRLVGADDQGPDVANVDIAARHGNGCQEPSDVEGERGRSQGTETHQDLCPFECR